MRRRSRWLLVVVALAGLAAAGVAGPTVFRRARRRGLLRHLDSASEADRWSARRRLLASPANERAALLPAVAAGAIVDRAREKRLAVVCFARNESFVVAESIGEPRDRPSTVVALSFPGFREPGDRGDVGDELLGLCPDLLRLADCIAVVDGGSSVAVVPFDEETLRLVREGLER